MIDTVVVGILFAPLSVLAEPPGDPLFQTDFGYVENTMVGAHFPGFNLFEVYWLGFNLLYYSVGISVWSTTVGKRLLGLYVLWPDGSKCSFPRAAGRWFAYGLSALILFIGFFMIGLRKDKRGLHDRICDTVVVRRPSSRI